MSIFDVGVFLIKGLGNGALTTRASSIAFKIFLAIFPAILFFFTLIPYFPIENFDVILLDFFADMMPKEAFVTIRDTIEDVATHKRGDLLSIGFLSALYFATNGVNSVISAFNSTTLTIETRSWYRQQLISVILVLIISVLMTVAITVTTFSGTVINLLIDHAYIPISSSFLLFGAKWIIIIALFYFIIAFIYYYAPAKKNNWSFFSIGSVIATGLTILISVGFSYYINNFGQYNKLYGSIGTLIVILMWMYWNSMVLLIGYELNVSIKNAKMDALQEDKDNKDLE
jgi:membrane protein